MNDDVTLAPNPVRRSHTARSATDPVLLASFERWRQNGDHAAREQIVERFMPLARKLALRYLGSSEPIDDLLQVANLGLVQAVNRFDPTRGVAFTSFAVPTILGELRRYFRDSGWAVHVSRGAQERALRVEAVANEIARESGRAPSVHQLATYLEWETSTVLESLEVASAHHATSLDAPTSDGDEDTGPLVDMLGGEDDRFAWVEDRLSVSSAMAMLPLVERRVLHLRFIDDLTQTQIGGRLGVSQMQVSRLLRSALERLRDLVEAG